MCSTKINVGHLNKKVSLYKESLYRYFRCNRLTLPHTHKGDPLDKSNSGSKLVVKNVSVPWTSSDGCRPRPPQGRLSFRGPTRREAERPLNGERGKGVSLRLNENLRVSPDPKRDLGCVKTGEGVDSRGDTDRKESPHFSCKNFYLRTKVVRFLSVLKFEKRSPRTTGSFCRQTLDPQERV